ncbi:hypothetical protein FRX31_027535 [Thalictrum thalictroides]|uniref:Uncharacterized protein n=1 Tax=Thalictrum thalictroides TaxID=46969 RepID=A0A7J6VE27_THATH|nr:hypothetical protein FRX31_027535 [Thalictrum thalictroides]
MVIQFGTRVIEGKILTGSHVNDRVFIPRITLEPTDSAIQNATSTIPSSFSFCNDYQQITRSISEVCWDRFAKSSVQPWSTIRRYVKVYFNEKNNGFTTKGR